MFRRVSYPAVRFPEGTRVAVVLVQHESNSFAVGTTGSDAFTVLHGSHAADELDGTNSEFGGALDELRRRGAHPLPVLAAHALPSGPLDTASASILLDLVDSSLRGAGPVDGVIAALHGAATSVDDPRFDLTLLAAIRSVVGPTSRIALTLDMHANVCDELVALADVVVGYATNPHVDQADTGRRGVELLAAVMTGSLRPEISVIRCPVLAPDEALRMPDGVLGRIVAGALDDVDPAVVEIGVFPTQPWLDAPEVGFTAVVTAREVRGPATVTASDVCRAVWAHRHDLVVERLHQPVQALEEAELEVFGDGPPLDGRADGASAGRPFVVTESADAPTAGATGDGTGMLGALIQRGFCGRAMLTIVDPSAVHRCHEVGIGASLSMPVGASADPRWTTPVDVSGEVVFLGNGQFRLRGVGYTGLSASMGRHAVVGIELPRRGHLDLLMTELPAWSGDPGAWLHAGLDPFDVDLLVVRSCSDYRANFPGSADRAVVADVPGAASQRLTRFEYRHVVPLPYPLDPDAVWHLDPDPSDAISC